MHFPERRETAFAKEVWLLLLLGPFLES